MDASGIALDMTGNVAENGGISFWLRITIVLVVLNLFGIYNCRYVLWGRTTEANVTSVRQIAAGKQLAIDFEFKDESGQRQKEHEDVPARFGIQEGDSITIEHVAGNPHSARVLGTGLRATAYVFFATVTALLVAIGVLWRFAWKAVHRPQRYRRFRFKTQT